MYIHVCVHMDVYRYRGAEASLEGLHPMRADDPACDLAGN